jgi:hypothetical protein
MIVMMTNSVKDNLSYNVKAAFKHACPHENKFKNSICSLAISVGQPAHEGDKFAATIDIINDTFGKCIIIIGDGLCRYIMSVKAHKNFAESHKAANILGKQWINRNKEIIDRLIIPYKIIRWDYWLNHPLFVNAKRKIDSLYSNDDIFRGIVNNAAENFTKRDQKRPTSTYYDYNKILNASVLYLQEECAAMLLWVTENIDFEIYPRYRNTAMEYVYKKFILPKYGETLLPLSIRFR